MLQQSRIFLATVAITDVNLFMKATRREIPGCLFSWENLYLQPIIYFYLLLLLEIG